MKHIIKIVESKHWKNIITGQTASIYGAVPYLSDSDKNNWTIEIRGYTWLKSDGTVGLGRPPTKTFDEALKIMNDINERPNE